PIPPPEPPRSKPPRPRPERMPARRRVPERQAGRRVSPAVAIIGFAAVALLATLLVSQFNKPSPPKATQVLGTSTQRPAPTAPAEGASDLSGYTLITADTGSDVTVAPFSGTRHTVAGFPGAGHLEPPVPSGKSIVVLKGSTAYVLTPPFTAAAIAIAAADHAFPALTDGGVGLWRAGAGGALPTVEIAAFPGSGIRGSAAVPFPRGLRPLAELPSGILVQLDQTSGLLQVWQPGRDGGSGIFVRTLGPSAGVVGWSGDRVAWLASAPCTSNGECPLHVTDVSTGGDVVVPPPPGFAGYLPGGAFSPLNSQLFATFVFNPVQHAAAARLVLVSLTSAVGAGPHWAPALVPLADVGLVLNSPAPAAAWTPDGAHVLFSGSSGRIHEYIPGRTASYPTEQPASSSFTVVQNAPGSGAP
ncbi:MAG TPA: hypothetical protein VET24_01545, partial [Actinomycetota bacterium]|nr:hypothetical protein [Actinomycetota bacterium]